jgi:hypothetical protein
MADNYEELLKQKLDKYKTAAAPVAVPEVTVVPEVPTAPVASGGYEELLAQKLKRYKEPTAPESTIPVAAPTEVTAPTDMSKEVYSENNLVEDRFFYPIQDYMVERYGTHMKDETRDEIVSQYVNNMRGFAGGNSMRSLAEISYLNGVSDKPESMMKAGQAYEIFENMQGITGDISWGETGSMVWDYTRSAVLDPVNLLGLGIGKVASGTGFKAGSQVALFAARQTYKKALAEKAVGGVVNEAAKKAAKDLAETAFTSTAADVTLKVNEQIIKRQAIEAAATTTFQRMTTKTALKEGAVTGAFEGTISAGTDYLYQDAMLRTKVQDEYNAYQTGLAGVVGLVAGGLSAMASNVRTGASGLTAPSPYKTSTKGATVISNLVNQTASIPPGAPGTISPPAGNWLKDVAKGVELRDQDTDFFVKMLLGDKDKGLKGLASILAEDGYGWLPRNPDDKVSHWIGDIIKESDPQDAKKFMDDFVAATGITMDDGKALTIEAFGDTFKRKMSDSGTVLNAASQVSKILGRKVGDMTANDYAAFMIAGVVPRGKMGAIDKAGLAIGEYLSKAVNRDLPDFQNNIIRLMVSNLSTTALNVAGYATTTAINSASDITRAVLFGGLAGAKLVTDPKGAKALGISALSIIKNQKTKLVNILDPNTTYDTFLQYAQVRPDVMRQLTSIDSFGPNGLDLDKPLLSMKADRAVDLVQKFAFVQAQDGYSKAFEFTSQLDKFLRRSESEGGFGMSWNEFFAQKKHHEAMMSEKYVALEAMAVDETLKATFSKSYKGPGALGQIAGVIEDARNIPGVGLLVPFGRFFNNTLATANELTAVGPLMSKYLGGQPTKFESEIFAKGLVAWTMVGTLALREKDYIAMGLGWSEEIDPMTGAVVDQRYSFPYAAIKAAARVAGHGLLGESSPKELTTQIYDQFIGQLTRELGDTGTGLKNIVTALLSEEGIGFSQLLGETLGSVASQAASGITRPLEPLNTLAGLTRDEQFYTPDRKQGTKWANNSLRYVDQLAALMLGKTTEEPLYSPTEGKPRIQTSRLVSTTRETYLSSTERMLNMAGRPTFGLNKKSLSEVANNRVDQLFFDILEDGAAKLVDSPAFKKGDLEAKQYLSDSLVTSARKSTRAYMGRVAANSGDSTLLKMYELSSYGKDLIGRRMKDLGFEVEFDELDDAQLDILEGALKFSEEIVLGRGE